MMVRVIPETIPGTLVARHKHTTDGVSLTHLFIPIWQFSIANPPTDRVWNVGGNQTTRRKPTQVQKERVYKSVCMLPCHLTQGLFSPHTWDELHHGFKWDTAITIKTTTNECFFFGLNLQ